MAEAQLELQATSLERDLRALKRNVLGVVKRGKKALEDETNENLFEAKLASATEDWKEFKGTWSKLSSLQLSLGNDFPDEPWQTMYDQLRDEIIEANSILITIRRRKQVADVSQQNATVTRDSMIVSSRTNLPKIPLPHFHDDLSKWTHFKDSFRSMVHEDPSLSNIERFHYLLGSLKGEAASLVAGIPVDGASYTLAWAKLLKEYDRPRVLASIFIQRMVDFDVGKFKNDVERYEGFLVDIADSINGFKALKLEDPGEFILAFLALRALDSHSRKEFEIHFDSNEKTPTAEKVIEFVRKRMSAHKMSTDFSASNHSKEPKAKNTFPSNKFPNKFQSSKYSIPYRNNNQCNPTDTRFSQHRAYYSIPRDVTPPRSQSKVPCPMCQGCHLLAYCIQFTHLPYEERRAFIDGWKGCKNCLRDTHLTSNCTSKWRCRFCNESHHSLLHPKKEQEPSKRQSKVPPQKSKPSSSQGSTFTGFGASSLNNSKKVAVLGTLQCFIKGHNKRLFTVRAVLDSGSQKTFMTQALARKIGVHVQEGTGCVTGLGGTTVSTPTGLTSCTIRPFEDEKEFHTEALVIESISPPLPSSCVDDDIVMKLSEQPLADPNFHQPGPIDILIGMDLYPSIMNGGMYHSGISNIYLQPTSFGLVVLGSYVTETHNDEISIFSDSKFTIQEQLKRFWELEEPLSVDRASSEDKFCEEHFVKTHLRTPEGRYVVRLPLKMGTCDIGNNVQVVTERFFSLEKRLIRDSEMNSKYKQFMQEYEKLGHMSLATNASRYLIPHHCVWQHRPGGRKLRVVFDASCPSSKGSLNDILLSGPKLQADITNILIQFRLFAIPLYTDLVKMYRQVLVHEDDRKLQHILWREDQKAALQEFELNTITYGVRPSAFLAMRVIQQLLIDEGDQYPLAVDRVKRSMYVDDIVTGADTIEQAAQLQRQLIGLFSKGGFSLSKWSSTVPALIPEEHWSTGPLTLPDPDSDYLKILGLVWNSHDDSFAYKVMKPPSHSVTKRKMLSAIARIFDPLGMLAPVTLYVKVLLQAVWKNRLDWDDKLTPEISEKWSSVADQWESLSTVKFPRYIDGHSKSYTLVGFSDASTVGYAASVYLRTETQDGKVHSALIKAKAKVAPTNYTSVARLELCGALLLARLMESIKLEQLRINPPYCFTASSVVLGWLKTPIHSLKVFEANRVNEILNTIPLSSWKHVKSEENPSDLASRGCLPDSLKFNNLWWHGPPWLLMTPSQWPKSHFNVVPDVSLNTQTSDMKTIHRDSPDIWMSRFSTYDKMIRTVVYILRWFKCARNRNTQFERYITVDEFRQARDRCVKLVQQFYLPSQIYHKADDVPKIFANLLPFLDEAGIVRVGGRLHESPLSYDTKHPILLPRASHLAKLIVEDIHNKHFHSGLSLTLSLLRMQWWIPGALKFIKGRILRCVKCRIQRAGPLNPLMAPIPKSRFSDTHAFHNTGVDYAGPFTIRHSMRRNSPTDKAYLAIFVCFARKAVHLEAVSALTTVALLAAMDRFFARRGLPKEIWSDHGSNFIGASRYLKDVYTFILKNDEYIAHQLAPKAIQWKFIPPRAPHFGGLWEAGVKSVKSLLPATLGKQSFAFEELSTAFTRVEGILNSRPLCALIDDPNSNEFLTPGHFLIGAPILSFPEQTDYDPAVKSNSRWQLIQRSVSTIWNRWRRDYLHTMQRRTKWSKNFRNLQVGDLVIMIEKRAPFGQWPVARLVDIHPGKDGIVRTVTIRTPNGKTYMRAVATLAPLIIPEE